MLPLKLLAPAPLAPSITSPPPWFRRQAHCGFLQIVVVQRHAAVGIAGDNAGARVPAIRAIAEYQRGVGVTVGVPGFLAILVIARDIQNRVAALGIAR